MNAPELQHEFGVWDASDRAGRAEWLTHWQSWPAREAACHPAYARLFLSDANDRAMAAYWRSDRGGILFPFILRRICGEAFAEPPAEVFHDIITPYGYGGPFCWGNVPRQSPAFWDQLDRWLRSQNVVSELVRFSLFRGAQLEYPGDESPRLTNIVCPLDRSEDDLWAGFKSKVRRNVNKAKREGVTVVLDETAVGSQEFQRIYKATMDRREADKGYYFTPGFFQQLEEQMAGSFVYFHALHEGTVISSELVLVSAENIYFFLGGTDTTYYPLRPNDLLKYEVMRWGRSLSKKRYVLGGGYEEGDGIFQYKQSFAPDGHATFKIGRRIHNQEVYDRLSARRRSRPPAPDAGFFPCYRAA